MTINLDKHRYALEKAANVLGAFFYVIFTATLTKDIINTQRVSSIFPIVLASVFIFFFLTRDIPKQLNLSPYDWFITLTGTFLTFWLRPAPLLHDTTPLIILQTIGVCISIAGILSLNKSLGLAPANRGVKTFWAYQYVRHPIYAGYFIIFGAYCAQNFTVRNVIITAVWMTCEILRLFAEEKYLSSDPVYAGYMKKVRWRMIPYLF